MFEETLRTLRELEGTTSILVSISNDEEGYCDRECPSEDCEFQFKDHLKDWKAKVRGEEVFCPFCGHAADSTEWNTGEQIQRAEIEVSTPCCLFPTRPSTHRAISRL